MFSFRDHFLLALIAFTVIDGNKIVNARANGNLKNLAMVIKDEMNMTITGKTIGPYEEGKEPRIICVASGVDPPPDVRWYQDGVYLFISGAILHESPGVLTSTLTLKGLAKVDQAETELACKAWNGRDFVSTFPAAYVIFKSSNDTSPAAPSARSGGSDTSHTNARPEGGRQSHEVHEGQKGPDDPNPPDAPPKAEGSQTLLRSVLGMTGVLLLIALAALSYALCRSRCYAERNRPLTTTRAQQTSPPSSRIKYRNQVVKIELPMKTVDAILDDAGFKTKTERQLEMERKQELEQQEEMARQQELARRQELEWAHTRNQVQIRERYYY